MNRKRLMILGADQRVWYLNAHKMLVQRYGPNSGLMAGFVASTSVSASVAANQALARKAYEQWRNQLPFRGYLSSVILNLERTTANLPLNGLKVENFRQALCGNLDAVVIDRWMLRAYGLPRVIRPKRYMELSDVIKREASRNGLKPAEYQAMVWAGIRRTKRSNVENFSF